MLSPQLGVHLGGSCGNVLVAVVGTVQMVVWGSWDQLTPFWLLCAVCGLLLGDWGSSFGYSCLSTIDKCQALAE